MKRKVFILGLLISSMLYSYFTIKTYAQSMSDDQYKVYLEDIEPSTPPVPSRSLRQTPTPSRIPFKPSTKPGFEDIKHASPFTFSINTSLLDFGILASTEPVLRTIRISVLNDSAPGYSVFAYEDQPLTATDSASTIPDTTCDSGRCSEVISDLWNSILTYGYGYRCDNITGFDCDSSFSQKEFFKSFQNRKANHDFPSFMRGGRNSQYKETQITHKINISATQPKMQYKNRVTYLGVPNF